MEPFGDSELSIPTQPDPRELGGATWSGSRPVNYLQLKSDSPKLSRRFSHGSTTKRTTTPKGNPMHVIDKDGNIIEGQSLTPEEVEILSELSTGEINLAASGYIPERDEKKIAAMLISKYKLTRRETPVGDDSEEAAS
jgi:hypothetical protein